MDYLAYLTQVDSQFWIRFLFPIRILIIEAMLVYWVKRKKKFALRLGLCFIGIFLMSYLLPLGIQIDNVWLYIVYNIVYYFTIFSATVVTIAVCFDIKPANAVFAGIAAYAIQHLSYSVVQIFMLPLRPYLTEYWQRETVTHIFTVVMYVIMYFIYARNFKQQETFTPENKKLVVIVTVVLLSALLLHFVETQFRSNTQIELAVVCNLYRIICCGIALALQSGMFAINKLEREKDIILHRHAAEKKQQQLSRENIEMLNMKIHDIKHQLLQLHSAHASAKNDTFITELSKAVSDYEATAKTGNDSLDVVLTEKLFLCEKKNIMLEYVVDGSLIDFIDPSDIYSLFGNAIDNAIDAVSDFDSEDKRHIELRIDVKDNFVRIICSNFYNTDLQIENGLPHTTKPTAIEPHGYGTKSMKYIVEKYNGIFKISTDNNEFILSAFIPLNNDNNRAQ